MDINARLEMLPIDLRAIYERIYQRIQDGGEFSAAAAFRALKWVICAYEPLTSKQLIEAVHINVQDETIHHEEEVTEEDLRG